MRTEQTGRGLRLVFTGEQDPDIVKRVHKTVPSERIIPWDRLVISFWLARMGSKRRPPVSERHPAIIKGVGARTLAGELQYATTLPSQTAAHKLAHTVIRGTDLDPGRTDEVVPIPQRFLEPPEETAGAAPPVGEPALPANPADVAA